MPEHLVFTLAATLAAMGDVAGHERRGSWTWPGRSAVLGLIGAAMGLRREGDFRVVDGLRLSVAVFEAGQPLRDYHTVQTVPTRIVKRPEARPLALRAAGQEANTTITLRDYRTDVLFGVAVTGDGLAQIAGALERPVFQLYLGRKSCPLSAPLAPRLVQADSAEGALAALRLPPWQRGARAMVLYADDGPADRVETRHDLPLDRRRWHFAARAVAVRAVTITPVEVA